MVYFVFVYDVKKVVKTQFSDFLLFMFQVSCHLTVKKGAIAMKFGMLEGFPCSSHICSGFLKILKIFGFFIAFLEKMFFFIFRGQKVKISKIRDSKIVERSILHLLVLFICNLLQN